MNMSNKRKLLGEILIKHLEYSDHGYSSGSKIFRELLWEIFSELGKKPKMSVEYEKLLKSGQIKEPNDFTGEHRVPVAVLLKEMIKMYKDRPLNNGKIDHHLIEQLFKYLDEKLDVVHVTPNENKKLNETLKMKQTVPIFGQCRYDVAGIEISKTPLSSWKTNVDLFDFQD